ncbi:MAG TPA: hypothetical protein VES20_05150, partial [Bryobacteraceae bacterium]|nr:hypothetical protein [Bryobacteraceae bacterium]
QAGALAARVAVSEETSANRIRLAFRLLYGRTPSAAEHKMALDFLARDKTLLTSDMPVDARTRAAWTGLMRVLLSSNEFFYVD